MKTMLVSLKKLHRNCNRQWFFIIGLAIICCLYGCSSPKTTDPIGKLVHIVKYDNDLPKMKRYIISDTTDFYSFYYRNGGVKQTYFKKKGQMHGLHKEYFQNGKLKSEGQWLDGKRHGTLYNYDSSGNLTVLRRYIKFRNDENARLNEVIRFNKADTILKSSLFYQMYIVSDSIQSDEEFQFKMKLRGHLFDNAAICLCNFDSVYNLPSKKICDTFLMRNFEVALSPLQSDRGLNVVRGVILNYEHVFTPELSKKTTNVAEVYFSKGYFVK